ncbi:hypothetical protein [Aquimarina sp. MMG016]|uniref:CIS tube protein n=1 Tax=Aquimarina sp. MMG016 TaxID=2822690 RepID=UPI001B39D2C2|nr:hypothetical protein [Aquimarina sp. MMG016]MBQ4818582.1 hypothetical protein [Aquimarina sp. MMG016]
MEDSGQLAKITIEAFDNENFAASSKSDITPNPIYLPINPESFTQNFKVEFNQEQGQGNQSTDSRYSGTKPEELKLDFIFDGTNSIQGYNSKLDKNFVRDQTFEESPLSVKEQLKIFMNTVYDMNGDIHKPHFLKVKWGDGFKFQCILSNLDLNYTLFQSNGEPLRVKASATFLNYIAQEERVARERKSSPDLTHARQVKAGDRLDNMVYDIYNNSKYITQVAKANGLTSFRKITPGRELVFPPIDKTSS